MGASMVWNKLKQQLETFISPSVKGRVEYLPSGYRYTKDKSGRCFLVVDGKEIFNKTNKQPSITWYQTEQEIINDKDIVVTVTMDEIEAIRNNSKNKIPEDRLSLVAKKQKAAQIAKRILIAQNQLVKTDFQKLATGYLSDSVDSSLKSDDILLNVLAIIDRRVGKKRLIGMEAAIRMKHPLVQYFYGIRLRPKG